MKLNFLKILSIFTLLIPSISFGLGSISTMMTVSATVIPTCTVSVQQLSLGVYDGLENNDGQATFTLTCQDGANATALFDGGKNSKATTRQMSSPESTSTLEYNLYYDEARTNQIPMNTNAANYTLVADGTAHTYNVYARIPAGQAVTASSYTDTVTLTISY